MPLFQAFQRKSQVSCYYWSEHGFLFGENTLQHWYVSVFITRCLMPFYHTTVSHAANQENDSRMEESVRFILRSNKPCAPRCGLLGRVDSFRTLYKIVVVYVLSVCLQETVSSQVVLAFGDNLSVIVSSQFTSHLHHQVHLGTERRSLNVCNSNIVLHQSVCKCFQFPGHKSRRFQS